ncbi:B-box zinc finger [Oxobacter pfennigii]|uniref:B-box zinc finger n=1 Tax=Oxobacter pfennigii TaxID=36849 RepID=A0A0P8W3C5_9CLOT|nr:B-box zinc finger protein [Oxobacter pfennigii]KPU43083.1 B-box zinc finger [Oxobacter pfennigii]
MRCAFHNEKDAEFICSSCGQPICRDCLMIVNGKNYCRTCGHNLSALNNTHQYGPVPDKRGDGISGFLFFIFLFAPGLRHMYLGLMKRGIHFLLTFFGAIAVGMLLGSGIGEVIIPVCFIVWFYSAFDSYQCRKLLARGEKVEDAPLFKDYGYEEIKNYFSGRKQLIGIAAIVLGGYLLLKQFVRYGWAFPLPNAVIRAIDFILRNSVPIFMILFGIYLIARTGKKAKDYIETPNE